MRRTYAKRPTKRRLSARYDRPTKRYKRAYAPKRVYRAKARYNRKKVTNIRNSYYQGIRTVRPWRSSYKTVTKAPVVRGTKHRMELYGLAYSSSTLSAIHPLLMVSRMSDAQVFGSSTITSYGQHTDFDAYGNGYPIAFRKIFHKGTKVTVRCTNLNENNITVRISLVQLRKGMDNADWNNDPHRVINYRHWKVHFTEKFVMDTGDFTPIVASGTTTGVQPNKSSMVTKEYYIPVNRWRKTRDGGPSNQDTDWNSPCVNDELKFRIDTDDQTSVDGQYVQFDFKVTQYFCTVETDET